MTYASIAQPSHSASAPAAHRSAAPPASSHSQSANKPHQHRPRASVDGEHGGAQPRWGAPHPSANKPHRHRPVTSVEEEHVYVLTLRLSPSLRDPLNTLRTRYFPAERLKVPAHLTLFHALPHSQLSEIQATIERIAGETQPFEVRTGEAFTLGNNGVAVSPGVGTKEGAAVHARLRKEWEGFLSKQDSKAFHAHWTVQNKVEKEEEVKKAFEEVTKWAKEEGAQGKADGLELFRYERGYWRPYKEYAFGR
ncbi:hypothetical protein JCM8547_007356 [Rhodosporidiobolus lusitaniae]